MRDSQSDIQEFVRGSSLIFSATVIKLNASSVTSLAARDNLAVVRVDRALRSDRALGDLRGKSVTVELLDVGELQPKERMIFFTLDWIHGGGIAAREVAHVDAKRENEVTAEVERLPERHLAERVADAVLIVLAEVTRIKLTPFDISWRNAPQWGAGTLRIVEVLRGQPGPNTTVLFPTSERPMWASAPRLTKGQRAIFLLHLRPDWAELPDSGPILTSGAFCALDSADIQPESAHPLVAGRLGLGGSQ
jgi:hypothetical protein